MPEGEFIINIFCLIDGKKTPDGKRTPTFISRDFMGVLFFPFFSSCFRVSLVTSHNVDLVEFNFVIKNHFGFSVNNIIS